MKENISINLKNTGSFITYEEVIALAQLSILHLESLNAGTGAGSDFLGWLTLPDDITRLLNKIEKSAEHLRSVSDTTVVIGIGGSYLGAKAVNEALSHSFSSLQEKKPHEIIYAGQNICEDYMADLLEILDSREYSIIVISKSGTTTEPALSFRILKDHLEKKVGKKVAADRIIAITDGVKGALRSLAETNGYETFIIPDNIGGRYSVLTPVGLLPIAVNGFDIKMLVSGAKAIEEVTRKHQLIPHCYMLQRETCFFRVEDVLNYLLVLLQGCITCQNGGNSFLERAKAKKARVSTRLPLILLPTSILWVSISRRVKESFLKR
jgi:glucose-6-phosphate isomerase